MASAFAKAVEDLRRGFAMRAVWTELAREDIGDQHRRTLLGPVWLLINYLLFVGTFVLVFGHQGDARAFARYAAVGMLVWFYISEVISLSTSLFVRESNFIRGTRLPLSVYVLRMFTQSLLRSTYAACGCLAILVLTGAYPAPVWLASLFGIVILGSASVPAIIIFAFGGTFFPDLQYIVQNIMRVGMFLTPIFRGMNREVGGLRGHLYLWNPFTYFIEIVREPILQGTIPWHAIGICTAIILALWPIALFLLGRYRGAVVFLV